MTLLTRERRSKAVQMPARPEILRRSEYFTYSDDGFFRTRINNNLSPRIGRVLLSGLDVLRTRERQWRDSSLHVPGNYGVEYARKNHEEIQVARVDNPRLIDEGLAMVVEGGDPLLETPEKRAYARFMQADLREFVQALVMDGIIR